MTIPVTYLASYDYCPRKFYLTTVLRLVEPPKEAIIRGTVRHAAVEEINRSEERIVRAVERKTDVESLQKEYENAACRAAMLEIRDQNILDKNELFAETLALISKLARQRAENICRHIEKLDVYADELWEKLIPKIKAEVTCSGHGLRGRVDEIRKYEGFCVPVEIKTGKAPGEGVWSSHRIQIAAYLMLIREARYGVIHYIDHDEYRKIMLNPFLESTVAELKDKVLDTMTSKKAPSKVKAENKCRNCQLKKECFDEQLIDGKIREVFRKL